jgi:glycosyltransferase involved in cell wall biosynthesis
VARYTAELDAELHRAGVDLRRFAFGRGPHAAPDGTTRLRVPLRALRATWRVAPVPRVEHLVRGCDLVHVTDLAPPPTRLPVVMTVHDLDAVDHPGLHSPLARRLQRDQLRAARDRATAVIADSHVTADALRTHGVSSDRITVVPLGTPRLAEPGDRTPPSGTYLLFVGSLDARKGLDILLEGFAAAELDDVRLLLVGPDGHDAAGVRARVTELGLDERVELRGRVDDAELSATYAGAAGFCFPSRAEGFGLPVLEAMAAGTPVLASDLPITREVAGSAAELVPVGDVRAWAIAMARLVQDGAARQEMVDAGRARARAFRWEDTAAATADVYRLVAAHPGRRR